MPRVISVNNHRFPGPNLYHAGPTAFAPGGGMVQGWVATQPGILISPYPANAVSTSATTMRRYSLITNTITTINIAGSAPRPDYTYNDRERPAFATLGGGFAQVLRIKDGLSGSATVTNWIWNDNTLSWSVGATLTISTLYNQNRSSGLYPLSLGRTFFEHGTQAWIYNRSGNNWTVAAPMPREVWAAGRISEGLLYLAGKEDEVPGQEGGSGFPYSAQSAQSFLFDASNNTYTDLGHALELKVPPTESFGGTIAVETRSGQMQQFQSSGVIGIGANSNWITYRHDLGIVASRARTQTPDNIQLLRPDPLCYALNTATTTDYVYSW